MKHLGTAEHLQEHTGMSVFMCNTFTIQQGYIFVMLLGEAQSVVRQLCA
ncbi:MAG: hypothetical protein MJZ19_00865 [Paludibacteraceae bacterium]|nr:hypothetical protein [Paludibacteraceae bacterium]